MNINKLIHYGRLLKPVDVTTDRGSQQVSYADDGDIYCAIEPLSARELLYAKQQRADVTHKITIRYTGRVSHRYRITWNSKTFELGPPISAEERKEEMVFTAVEIC